MKNLKLLFVLFLGIGLTFASCKKDEEEEETNPPAEKTCYIVKETNSDSTYGEYTYNSDNQVINYSNYKENGDLEDHNEITYSDGNISMLKAYEGSTLSMQLEFKYSTKLDSVIMYMDSLGTLKKAGFYLYSYSGSNISKISTYFKLMGIEKEVSKMEYTYNGDNISTVKSYGFGIVQPELESITTYEYDAKVNPFRGIGLNDLLGEVQFMSKNNITKKTYKDADGNTDDSKSYNYTYEYNSNDYYTKSTVVSFDNSETKIMVFDYTCK